MVDDFIERLIKTLEADPYVMSAGRIDGEDTVGVEMIDGTEYFLAVTAA